MEIQTPLLQPQPPRVTLQVPAGVLPGVQRGMELRPGGGTARELPCIAAKRIEITLLMDSKLHREIIVVRGDLVNAWLGLEVAQTISFTAKCFEMETFCWKSAFFFFFCRSSSGLYPKLFQSHLKGHVN